MNLTMSRERPSNLAPAECIHCDEQITANENNHYVRIVIGTEYVNFHDPCFVVFLKAINHFSRLFVNKESGWGELPLN